MCTDEARAPRLLNRAQIHRQSTGKLNINRESSGIWATRLRWSDPFHSVVSWKTWKICAFVIITFVMSWAFFMVLFRSISDRCGLHANTFLKALYLAIETIETVGYGVEDEFYHQCYEGIFVLGLSAIWESLLNAALISIVCARVARGNTRATSIIFSEKAIITEVDGHWYFMFQVCDFRKHQLCEAHARMYSIQHSEAPGGIRFQTRNMRMQHPDDELGGMLVPALPQVVVHRIDRWSPLCPTEQRRPMHGTKANSWRYPEIVQRAADGEAGDRDPYFRAPGDDAARNTGPHADKEQLDIADIAKHLAQNKFEVLCLVEGIEATTSSTMQARHSYTCDDVVFNANFQRCVSCTEAGHCRIDFDNFHDLVYRNRTQAPVDGEWIFVQSMP